MTTPTNKKSKAKTRARRANHDRTTLQVTVICPNCSADKLPHRACPSCGWHKGRVAVAIKQRSDSGPAELAEE
jgi:large subunit ribosomal protein L32